MSEACQPVGGGQPARAKEFDMKVLMVLTSHDKLGDTGEKRS